MCVSDDIELRPVSGRLEIRVLDRSNEISTHTVPATKDTKKSNIDANKLDTRGIILNLRVSMLCVVKIFVFNYIYGEQNRGIIVFSRMEGVKMFPYSFSISYALC